MQRQNDCCLFGEQTLQMANKLRNTIEWRSLLTSSNAFLISFIFGVCLTLCLPSLVSLKWCLIFVAVSSGVAIRVLAVMPVVVVGIGFT